MKNETALLMYLINNGPWEGKKTKHNIVEYWWQSEGLIAVSIGVKKMAFDLGVSQRTIINWTNNLERDGYLVKIKGKNRETVYILGERPNGYYYLGDVKADKLLIKRRYSL